jgi:hypothetical protein
MKSISPYNHELIKLLHKELGFRENAIIKHESTLKDSYPLQFDLIIEDGSKTYVIEFKRIVRLDGLSKLGLLKLLLNTNNIRTYNNIPYNTEFVIVGKRITQEAAEAAEKIGIRFIKLPADMYMEEAHDKSSHTSVKLTSPKSWQVVSHLLRIKEASIRHLSIESGVSYGWTHATAQTLVSKGIASDARGHVKIIDINKLLNGIAWERPFEKLLAQQIRIDADSAAALAKEISVVCDEQQIPCSFTSFTAGELYTGYSARHDSVYLYLYLEKKNMAELAGMFEMQTNGGMAVRIYTPDRNVFKDRRRSSIENIWLVSPAQALLDCAGLGYAGRDLTLKLVDIYEGS